MPIPQSASIAMPMPCSRMISAMLSPSAGKGDGLGGQISGRLLTSQGAIPSRAMAGRPKVSAQREAAVVSRALLRPHEREQGNPAQECHETQTKARAGDGARHQTGGDHIGEAESAQQAKRVQHGGAHE